nr:immunoglobulin heavy chain junction region [Mus musculus]
CAFYYGSSYAMDYW